MIIARLPSHLLVSASAVAVVALFIGVPLASTFAPPAGPDSTAGAPDLIAGAALPPLPQADALSDDGTPAPVAPAVFTRNTGQAGDSSILYYTRAGGLLVGFGAGFARYILDPAQPLDPRADSPGEQPAAAVVTVTFGGARGAPPAAMEPAAGSRNFFLGSDAAAWQRNVPSYRTIAYTEAWPGIDLVYRATADGPKYEVVARPGADLSRVSFAYDGADGLEVTPEGAIVATTSAGPLSDSAPTASSGGSPVSCAFEVRDGTTAGFSCPGWDGNRTLVIDPLVFATFLGGTGTDYGRGVRIGPNGTIYVGGFTSSSNFPSTNGAYDTSQNGGYDYFVSRFKSDGTLEWATYIGGSSTDEAFDLWVDSAGDAYLTGIVASTNFPTTAGAWDSTHNGGSYDVGAVKVDATGSQLLFSTYIGGTSNDYGYGIAVGSGNTVYVGGFSSSSNYQTTVGAYKTTNSGGYDVVISRLNQTGYLLNSTYIGGSSTDEAFALRTDGGGLPVVTGYAASTNFPTTSDAAQRTNSGGYDVFLARMTSDLSNVIYSTYLGGSTTDIGEGLTIVSGTAYITGASASSNFPTAGNAFSSSWSAGYDAFLSMINLGTGALIYSAIFGGSSTEYGYGVAVNGFGEAVVAGYTASTNFPVTTYRDQQNHAGNYDTFVVRLNAAGSQMTYGTLLGGSSTDYAYSLALDSNGSAYITGYTSSTNFPVTPGAWDTSYASADAFLVKLDMRKPRLTITTEPPGLFVFDQDTNVSTPFIDECTGLRRINTDSPQYDGETRYVFDRWSNDGTKLQTVDCSLGDVSVVAYFKTEFLANFTTTPPGLQLTVDDIPRNTPLTVWWENGTQHHVDAMALFTANKTRYTFDAWSEGGTGRFDWTANRSLHLAALYTVSQHYFEAQTDRPNTFITLDGNRYDGPVAEWLDAGSTHTLAAPDIVMVGSDIRNTFANWSDGGALSRTFDINSPMSLVAHFTTEFFTTIVTDPEGISIEFDGVETATPISGWWPQGQSHHLKGPFDEVELGATRYRLTGWVDSFAAERTVYADNPVTYTALFTPSSYKTSVDTVPAGLDVILDRESYTTPTDVWWEVGTDHVVQAVSPQQGVGARYVFSGWSDHLQVTHVVTATGPIDLTARYSTEYEVTVDTEPTGLSVSVDGVPGTAPLTVWWAEGARHDLGTDATQSVGAAQRWDFDAWSDGLERLHAASATSATTFVATFAPTFLLSIVSVHAPPPCDVADCWYRGGTNATFHVDSPQEASKGVRFTFDSWTGDYSSTDETAVVLMDGPKTVTAVWKLQYELTVVTAYGNATGAGWYDEGERAPVSLSATQAIVDGTDYGFVGWTGASSSQSAETSVAMDGPKTVTAAWQPVESGEPGPGTSGGSGGGQAGGPLDMALVGGLGAAAAAAAVVGLLLVRRRRSGGGDEEPLAAAPPVPIGDVHASVASPRAASPRAAAPPPEAAAAPTALAQRPVRRQAAAAPPSARPAPPAPAKPSAIPPPPKAPPAAKPGPAPAPKEKAPGPPAQLKCHSCGQPVEAAWSVCPFCEVLLLR